MKLLILALLSSIVAALVPSPSPPSADSNPQMTDKLRCGKFKKDRTKSHLDDKPVYWPSGCGVTPKGYQVIEVNADCKCTFWEK